MELYAKRLFDLGSENAFKMGAHITAVELQGKNVIKLNLGEPDFNIPDCMKAEIKHQIDLNNTHYCNPKGLLTLREAISRQIYATRGLTVSPDRIVVFPGAKPSIGFSQAVYCNPNDEIIYPSPGFPIYESFIHYVGAIPKPIHLKESAGFSLLPEQLANAITPKTKLIFLNFPSNPTGGVATPEQLQALSQVILNKCNEHTRVYSDEIYEHITFDGTRHHSIASLPGMEERTIISSGFSKTFAWTGGRVGYAILPSIDEANMFTNLNINYFSCVPPYNQEAARVGLEYEDAQAKVKEMVGIFQRRRDLMLKALGEIPGLTTQKPSGAFYLFPNIENASEKLGVLQAFEQLPEAMKTKTSPSTLFQMFALYYHGVAIMDRRSFCKLGSETEHYIRISCAAEDSVLIEGAKRLKNAFEDNTGFRQFIRGKGPWY